MAANAVLLLLLAVLATSSTRAAHDLSQEYRFARSLTDDDQYWLHWSIDTEKDTISLAVNVSTTGWVGFGISPNGQMPNSDVVIGWVNDVGNQFQDRHTIGRVEPSIDVSEDWILRDAEEASGRTILEFYRKLVTCDDEDIPITANTARVIWSWGREDPSNVIGLSEHTNRGSASVNFLGGLNEERAIPETFFDVTSDAIIVPNDIDTTYWCRAVQIPKELEETEHFMIKFSPIISPNERAYVHHMVVFLCPFIFPENQNFSGVCPTRTDTALGDIFICTNTGIIGSWAVGGEDFVFPEGVGFPLGGSSQTVLLEIHYDNPNLDPEVRDSSGLRFFYTATAPEHRAGIMTFGHDVTKTMVIPPTTEGYTSTGICTGSCTKAWLPEEGINIFANIFHTHLIGNKLKLRHYTQDNSTCNGWKELEPIDENLSYDFNYQQTNILQSERTIQPGDSIELECVYSSSDRTGVTLGGEATTEEMCLSFVVYYPEVDLTVCVSSPALESFTPFIEKYIETDVEEVLENLRIRNTEGIKENFNSVQWTTAAMNDLETSVRGENILHFCISHLQDSRSEVLEPELTPIVQCPYEPVPQEQCAGSTGLYCHQSALFLAFFFSLTLKMFLS